MEYKAVKLTELICFAFFKALFYYNVKTTQYNTEKTPTIK